MIASVAMVAADLLVRLDDDLGACTNPKNNSIKIVIYTHIVPDSQVFRDLHGVVRCGVGLQENVTVCGAGMESVVEPPSSVHHVNERQR